MRATQTDAVMLLFKEKCFELKDLNMLELKGSLWSIWPLCFFSSSSEWLPVFVCHMYEHECVCARPLMHSVKYNPTNSVTQVHSSTVAGRCQECANKGWEKQDCQLIDVHLNGCWFLSFICAVVVWGLCVCLQFCIWNKLFFMLCWQIVL